MDFAVQLYDFVTSVFAGVTLHKPNPKVNASSYDSRQPVADTQRSSVEVRLHEWVINDIGDGKERYAEGDEELLVAPKVFGEEFVVCVRADKQQVYKLAQYDGDVGENGSVGVQAASDVDVDRAEALAGKVKEEVAVSQ